MTTNFRPGCLAGEQPCRRPPQRKQVQTLPDHELDDEIWLRVSAAAGTGLRSLSVEARAHFATRLFEWEVLNGGLHQFFFNRAEPEILGAVTGGYRVLGLSSDADRVEALVVPNAADEVWMAGVAPRRPCRDVLRQLSVVQAARVGLLDRVAGRGPRGVR